MRHVLALDLDLDLGHGGCWTAWGLVQVAHCTSAPEVDEQKHAETLSFWVLGKVPGSAVGISKLIQACEVEDQVWNGESDVILQSVGVKAVLLVRP